MTTQEMRDAFVKFANLHKDSDEIFKTSVIQDNIKIILNCKSPSMCASDFAKPEIDKARSKQNPWLFERVKRGQYKIRKDVEKYLVK